MEAHWQLFHYRKQGSHWHNFWCRWTADGALSEKFRAERVFTPLPGENGCTQHIVYHYEDERGMVTEGPLNGPWTITEMECSKSDGIVHPARKEMTTLCLPGMHSAWCWRDASAGQPCAVEVFLHYKSLRMSAGIVHRPDGKLKQVALIREDCSGGGSDWPRVFKSDGWTENTTARVLAGAEQCLSEMGVSVTQPGSGNVTFADLKQEGLTGGESALVALPDWGASLLGSAGPKYAFVLCGDSTIDRVVLVGLLERQAGEPFACSAIWWPSGSSELLTIEVWYDSSGAISSVRQVSFPVAAK
ncbi:MAG: hypothetical protein SGPRY_006625 [Prymnesium sp.]